MSEHRVDMVAQLNIMHLNAEYACTPKPIYIYIYVKLSLNFFKKQIRIDAESTWRILKTHTVLK